jgi:hypothetical protein
MCLPQCSGIEGSLEPLGLPGSVGRKGRESPLH